MKKEYADKWIAALRSGKYKQGKHTLCTVEGKTAKYCCLGVLCHILNTPYKKEDTGLKSYLGETRSLPVAVMQEAGLKTNGGWELS